MKQPEDIGDAIECMSKLRTALQLMLDAVDYTNQACQPNEMIGACLPRVLIERAHQALEDTN